jgi:hypothetical protein
VIHIGIRRAIDPVSINADFSIRDNLDSDSNLSEVSDRRKKQLLITISTNPGIAMKPIGEEISSLVTKVLRQNLSEVSQRIRDLRAVHWNER